MGGQSIPSLDYYLAPYVAKSFIRNFAKYIEITYHIDPKELKSVLIKPIDKWIFNHENRVEARIMNNNGRAEIHDIIVNDLAKYYIDDDVFFDAWDYAEQQTNKDTFQAMESLVHNLCTMQSRAGNQTPFSSVNLGIDISPEGRLVTKNLFLAQEKGLGNGETAIFPISIMKMKKGVTDKGSPNYDLFQLACRVSTKRLFPNFLNLDSSFNLPYYKTDDPDHHVATMGMIDSGRVFICYKQNYDAITRTIKDSCCKHIDIKNLGDFLVDNELGVYITEENKPYLNLVKVTGDVSIFDTYSNKWTKLNLWLKDYDPELEWYHVKTDKGFDHTLSHDHPLVVKRDNKWSRVQIKDLIVGDMIYGNDEHHHTVIEIDKIIRLNDEKIIGYDVNTESDRFGIDGIASHNCRTRVIGNTYDPSKAITPGRGNLFFITVNLPFIALRAKRRIDNKETNNSLIDEFWKLLDEMMDEVFDCELDRFKMIATRKAKNYPFLLGQHLYVDSENLYPDDSVEEVIKHGTITTGFIGLAETLVVLTGKHHGESEEAQELGLKIISHMNDRCNAKAEETKLNFSLMGSPAEGCCGRLLRLTKKEFGEIKGVTDHAYLTNSHHKLECGFMQ